MKIRPILMMILTFLCLASVTPEATAQRSRRPGVPPGGADEWTQAQLWPGESYTYEGVTVTWKVSGATSEIVFQGPTKTFSIATNPLFSGKSEDVYVDEVAFMAIGRTSNPAGEFVSMTVGKIPSSWEFNATAQDDTLLLVSSLYPLSLNNWRFSVSDKPVTYPDGAEYLVLTGIDPETNKEITMPATQGARRRFGRFEVNVDRVSPLSRTARLRVSPLPDTTIRGKDAYVEAMSVTDSETTCAELLGQLAGEYGFTVEWVEFPTGHPESIEYARKITPTATGVVNVNCTLTDLFQRLLEGNGLGFEWTDSTHLRVWAAYFDKVLEENERVAELEKQRKALEEQFEKEYTAELRIYALTSISPAAAKAIVDPVISRYIFGVYEGNVFISTPDEIKAQYGTTWANSDRPIEEGVTIYRETKEEAIADERANSLIVTAIPKTHERIKEILGKMDAVLAKETQPVGPPCQLEVVLLRGQKMEESTGKAPNQIEIRFPFSPQPNETTSFLERGMRVKAGDILAQVDTKRYRDAFERYTSTLNAAEASVAEFSQKMESAKKDYQMSRMGVDDYKRMQWELEKAKANLEQASNELQAFEPQYRLHIDNATLRAPVSGTITDCGWPDPSSGRPYIFAVTLLPDDPTDVAAGTREIGLRFPIGGRIADALVDKGAKVNAGDPIARLDTGDLGRAVGKVQVQLETAQKRLDIAANERDREKELFDKGRGSAGELDAKNLAVVEAQSEVSLIKMDLQSAKWDLQRGLEDGTLKAPVSGTINSLRYPGKGAMVSPQDTIATLLPDEIAETTPEMPPPPADLAKQYGISKEDLELFDLEGVFELGNGLVSLMPERGEVGKAKVAVGEGFTCEMEYIDTREPYLIVRGRLLGEAPEKTLIENTLYLEKGKPSLLGLTNLREALILIVKRR